MSGPGRSIFYRRPALAALAFLAAGILIASFFRIPYYYPLILFVASLMGALYGYFARADRVASFFLMLSLVFLGWHLGAVSRGPFPPNHIANIVGEGLRTEIAGSVIEEPDVRLDKTYLIMEADSLKIERAWVPTLGRIRVRIAKSGLSVYHGDYLKIVCHLHKPNGATNPMGFDYAAYLATKEIFGEAYISNPNQISVIKRGDSFLSAYVSPFRQELVAISNKYLPPAKAAMLTGFILGERRGIPDEYERLFRDTGTMHLMAVSGSNVAVVLLIIGIILTVFPMPRNAKAIALLCSVAGFAVLTRLEPSVIRASIMAAVGIVAYGWIRKPDPINLLGFAGLLMLLWRPPQLFEVGFQLSFAATFGIIYALPMLSGAGRPLDRPTLRWLKWAALALLGTVAAQVAVLPLVARYFHAIPVAGAIANIPIIILAGVAIAFGIALFTLSIFGGWLPLIAAVPLGIILEIILAILRLFASLPQAKMASASLSWPTISLFWITAYLIFEMAFRHRLSKTALISSMILLNIFIWGQALEKSTDWRIEFPDLRRNHAWIFSAPARPTVACYDVYELEEDAEDVLIPLILNRFGGKLDYLFTSTPDSSEIVSIASEFKANIVALDNGFKSGTENNGSLDEIVPAAGIKVLWDRSDNINAGSNAYPAIEISVDGGVLILAGWAGMTIREEMYDSNIKLIELPWSQYARSSCLEIIERCDPLFAVFSSDRYSTRAPRQRDQLTHSREKTLSTSLCGAFAVFGRGDAIEIETMKPRK